ncbi:hypothetical protein JKG47_06590 [Acidithiobacillus sp. MC6.1]|nr:hypothetical protein [Acidithiobacillus sp. MC6.1]
MNHTSSVQEAPPPLHVPESTQLWTREDVEARLEALACINKARLTESQCKWVEYVEQSVRKHIDPTQHPDAHDERKLLNGQRCLDQDIAYWKYTSSLSDEEWDELGKVDSSPDDDLSRKAIDEQMINERRKKEIEKDLLEDGVPRSKVSEMAEEINFCKNFTHNGFWSAQRAISLSNGAFHKVLTTKYLARQTVYKIRALAREKGISVYKAFLLLSNKNKETLERFVDHELERWKKSKEVRGYGFNQEWLTYIRYFLSIIGRDCPPDLPSTLPPMYRPPCPS